LLWNTDCRCIRAQMSDCRVHAVGRRMLNNVKQALLRAAAVDPGDDMKDFHDTKRSNANMAINSS